MITLELTSAQADEVLFATSLLYQDYFDEAGAAYNDRIRAYNNTVDELRQTIKEQIKEQEA